MRNTAGIFKYEISAYAINMTNWSTEVWWRIYASIDLVIIGSYDGFVACSAPSHYLNRCWLIENWTPWNKLLWNLNQNVIISSQEIAFANVVCIISTILFLSQYVLAYHQLHLYVAMWVFMQAYKRLVSIIWPYAISLFGGMVEVDISNYRHTSNVRRTLIGNKLLITQM